jgi:hypothetical protein
MWTYQIWNYHIKPGLIVTYHSVRKEKGNVYHYEGAGHSKWVWPPLPSTWLFSDCIYQNGAQMAPSIDIIIWFIPMSSTYQPVSIIWLYTYHNANIDMIVSVWSIGCYYNASAVWAVRLQVVPQPCPVSPSRLEGHVVSRLPTTNQPITAASTFGSARGCLYMSYSYATPLSHLQKWRLLQPWNCQLMTFQR